MWLLPLALAGSLARPDLARAKEAFAASKDDLDRARADKHVWKARLEEAQAEARAATGAAAGAEARGLVLAAKVSNEGRDMQAAQNASRSAQKDEASRAEARARGLEHRAQQLWELAHQLEPAEEPNPPLPKVARALRGLVDDARQSKPAPAQRASQVEANATALADEVQVEKEEVGVLASDAVNVEQLVVATRAESDAIDKDDAAHSAEVLGKVRALAQAVGNLTAFAPNVSATVQVPAALRDELLEPIPAMPDPTAAVVLRVKLKAATETRAADEQERVAHLHNVEKLEKELSDLEQKSSNLASELR